MKQKIYNTLYGAIVADALGVPVEFQDRDYLKQNPVTDMIGYRTYNLPKGSWSDDSSMTLGFAESIGRLGKIDYDDIMQNFLDWYKKAKFTPDHHVFDIGRTCQSAIENFRKGTKALDCGLSDERSNGNGSLMRIAPLPFYLFIMYGAQAMDKEESFELIHNISKLTHAHPISLIGCDIYCAIMLEIINGTKKSEILPKALPKIGAFVRNHPEFEDALSKYERITHQSFASLPENGIKSTGYIVDSLEAALWCFLTTDNYRDCVLKAVNLGYDTDTVACIAGSIAGLYYGDIPDEWINSIRNKKLVDKIIESFFIALNIPTEQYKKENELIAKAIAFATEKHSKVINKDGSVGQKRKGSGLPYIVHPMEVWQILRNNDCSTEVQIAGLLHDTLEDTDTTPEEIKTLFGEKILSIVLTESEDKSKTWKERKQHTIDALAHDSIETMQVCCADKLSNCRAQLYDYKQIGDALFERFNKQSTPELQTWYYKSIVKALAPLKGMKMYKELCEVVSELYG